MRNAFKMKLKPGCVAEYKKRHDEIWPELFNAHSDAGIPGSSIYFDEHILTYAGRVRYLRKNIRFSGLVISENHPSME